MIDRTRIVRSEFARHPDDGERLWPELSILLTDPFRKSAQWFLKSVDQCWKQKERFYAEAEMDDAIAAYDYARQTYRRILGECDRE